MLLPSRTQVPPDSSPVVGTGSTRGLAALFPVPAARTICTHLYVERAQRACGYFSSQMTAGEGMWEEVPDLASFTTLVLPNEAPLG